MTVGEFKELFQHSDDEEPLELELLDVDRAVLNRLVVVGTFSLAGGRAISIGFQTEAVASYVAKQQKRKT